MSNDAPLQVAYYAASVEKFLRFDADTIYGALSRNHPHAQELAQKSAWLEQIALLKSGLSGAPQAFIAFEFSIPRMGIYVPRGDEKDHTRPRELYDGIADYLKNCGIAHLPAQ